MSETTTDRWALPTEINDAEMVFAAGALKFMPSLDECEAGLRLLDRKTARMWRDFQATWFFEGLSPDVEFTVVEGVDGATAIRHLKTINGSFAPKHEHKEAAVAYLASRWFTSVKNYEKRAGA